MGSGTMEKVNKEISSGKKLLGAAKKIWQKYGGLIIPFLGLIIVVITFTIISKGAMLRPSNIRNIISQATATAVIATGAVFLFSLGMLDLSLGSACAVSSILAAMASQAAGGSTAVILLICIAVPVVILIFNGVVIGITKLPAFIVTLVMMNLLSSLARMLIPEGTTGIDVPAYLLNSFNNAWVKLAILAFVLIVAIFVFNHTPLGRKNKVLGGNRLNANLSGIDYFKNTFLSYLFCGVTVGIGAFMLLSGTGKASQTTGMSIGFDVIICLVLGGMSVSGGMSSKISAGVIGSFTIVALNNGLVMVGVPVAYVQAIRGIVFLIIVTLMALKSRTKYLV